jgi:hypothetical protein
VASAKESEVHSVAAELLPRRVIFLNRYFYPDHAATGELLSSLAFGLARRVLEVQVITSRLRYEDTSVTLSPREFVHGVNVWRI